MSTYVLGDCHGAHLALLQCLERCDFDPIEDTLISLGDICDGWPFIKETVEILQSIPKFQAIRGNHDHWAIQWAEIGQHIPLKQLECVGHHFDQWGRIDECLNCGMHENMHLWISQGGKNTVLSYDNNPSKFPLEWFQSFPYYIENEDMQLCVHGGIDPNQKNMEKQTPHKMMWDRDLTRMAKIKHAQKPNFKYGGWKDIFVGHTTTEFFGVLEPLHYCNVWMLDTGAGWSGKLTILDVHTKQYWQSDLVPDLYPNIKGRR